MLEAPSLRNTAPGRRLRTLCQGHTDSTFDVEVSRAEVSHSRYARVVPIPPAAKI